MKDLQVHIKVDEIFYSKNPDRSDLGRKIVSTSISMISELGLENFTFKKLGVRIGSPESSIYRYFDNKHALLVYLVAWYWNWVDYRIAFSTANIKSPEEKLNNAIDILVQPVTIDRSISHINEVLLKEIIITESVKAYHTKNVDKENKNGNFKDYKKVVHRVSELVLEVSPNFEYPHMLISTIIEGMHQQRYFAEHLPSLTDIKSNEDAISSFYHQLIKRVLV